jgi:hypothetical protein
MPQMQFPTQFGDQRRCSTNVFTAGVGDVQQHGRAADDRVKQGGRACIGGEGRKSFFLGFDRLGKLKTADVHIPLG